MLHQRMQKAAKKRACIAVWGMSLRNNSLLCSVLASSMDLKEFKLHTDNLCTVYSMGLQEIRPFKLIAHVAELRLSSSLSPCALAVN